MSDKPLPACCEECEECVPKGHSTDPAQYCFGRSKRGRRLPWAEEDDSTTPPSWCPRRKENKR